MSRDEKSEQPEEKDAVSTTIVGGRPPGSGTQVGEIARGVEVLVKKASSPGPTRFFHKSKRDSPARMCWMLSRPSQSTINRAVQTVAAHTARGWSRRAWQRESTEIGDNGECLWKHF